MWQDEVQRIGKQRCTPTGFRLHGISDLIGFVAMLLVLAVPCYLIYSLFRGTFSWSSLWLLLAPIGFAIIGNILHSYSWHLADIRNFEYDYEKRISTWHNHDGTIGTFNYDDLRAEYADQSNPADN